MSETSSPATSETSTTTSSQKRKRSKKSRKKLERYIFYENKYNAIVAREMSTSQPTTPFIGTPRVEAAIPLYNNRQHNADLAVQSQFFMSTTPARAIEIFTRSMIEPLHYPQQQYSGCLPERTNDESSIVSSFPIRVAEGQQRHQPHIGQISTSQLADDSLSINDYHLSSPSFYNNSFGGLQGNHCYPEQQQPRHYNASRTFSKTNFLR